MDMAKHLNTLKSARKARNIFLASIQFQGYESVTYETTATGVKVAVYKKGGDVEAATFFDSGAAIESLEFKNGFKLALEPFGVKQSPYSCANYGAKPLLLESTDV